MKKIIVIFTIVFLYACEAREDANYCSNEENIYVSAILDNEEKVVGEVKELGIVAGSLFLGESSTIITRFEGESFEWTFQLILPDILFEEGESYSFDDDLEFYFNTGSIYKGLNGVLNIEELLFTTDDLGYKKIEAIKATLIGQYQKNPHLGYEDIYDINMTFCGRINSENE